jgi:hypothetical protein
MNKTCLEGKKQELEGQLYDIVGINLNMFWCFAGGSRIAESKSGGKSKIKTGFGEEGTQLELGD